jgi:hypothetical protein
MLGGSLVLSLGVPFRARSAPTFADEDRLSIVDEDFWQQRATVVG